MDNEPTRRLQPNKFTVPKRAAYLEELRNGKRRGQAAQAVGISRQQVRAFANEYPEFQAEMDQAEIDACDAVEDALYQQALKGNITACLVWLYNRSGDRWKDKRNHLVAATGLPPEVVKAIEDISKRASSVKIP
jgi:hypothetical protein